MNTNVSSWALAGSARSKAIRPLARVEPPALDAYASMIERMAALESRLVEQDRTIRHTLTMLIEWIEADDAHRAAA